MHKFTCTRAIPAVLMLAGMLGACGTRGPLTLPPKDLGPAAAHAKLPPTSTVGQHVPATDHNSPTDTAPRPAGSPPSSP